MVDVAEAPEEHVVLDPFLDRNATRRLLQHSKGEKSERSADVLEDNIVQLGPLDLAVLPHSEV